MKNNKGKTIKLKKNKFIKEFIIFPDGCISFDITKIDIRTPEDNLLFLKEYNALNLYHPLYKKEYKENLKKAKTNI